MKKTPSGPRGEDRVVEVEQQEARQGATGHNVRYVLLFGLGGVIIAFVIVFMMFRPFSF